MKLIIIFVLLLWFSLSDGKEKEIPVKHLFIGVLFSIGIMAWDRKGLVSYGISIMPGMLMVLIAFFAKEKIGYADGIISIMLGIWHGIIICLETMLMAQLMLLGVFIVLIILKKADQKTTLPYIPYLFFSWCLVQIVQFLKGNII